MENLLLSENQLLNAAKKQSEELKNKPKRGPV